MHGKYYIHELMRECIQVPTKISAMSPTSKATLLNDNGSRNLNAVGELRATKGTVIASLNIRNLFRKLDEIQILPREREILLLQESLNHSCSNAILNILGYILYRWDRDSRPGKGVGGRVCAYVSIKCRIEHLEDWNLCCEDIEYQWLVLKMKDTRDTYIANVYCPPQVNVTNALEPVENKVLDILGGGIPSIVIAGDLNIDWGIHNDSKTKHEKRLVKELQLTHLIITPTRVTQTSQTTIDHFIVNRPELFQCHSFGAWYL